MTYSSGQHTACSKCGAYYSVKFTQLKEFPCPLCKGPINGYGWYCDRCKVTEFALETDRAHRAGPEHQKWLAENSTTREELLRAAEEEAERIRTAARESAKEEKQRVMRQGLRECDEQIRAKRAELDRVAMVYAGELEEIAMHREDRLLWDASPTEIKAHVSFVEDMERRTDLAIAILLHRGESPGRVASALYVPVGRVERVLRGDGVKESPLETVRSMMGPRPDGYALPREEAATPAVRGPESKDPKPRPDVEAIRAMAFRMFDEGGPVRAIAKAIGKSVGFAQKLRAEWVAQRSAATAPVLES